MVLKKIKDSEQALSRNHGNRIKYIKRKQEDKESQEALKEYNEHTTDHPRPLPGVDWKTES